MVGGNQGKQKIQGISVDLVLIDPRSPYSLGHKMTHSSLAWAENSGVGVWGPTFPISALSSH